MPDLLENLVMDTSGWPGGAWSRRRDADRLDGPRPEGGRGADGPTRLIKFHTGCQPGLASGPLSRPPEIHARPLQFPAAAPPGR